MYVEPNSRFILLKGCPLDNTYTHTIWFEDKTAQFDYFYSLKKHDLTKQSYQRYDKGIMSVEIPADRLYDCNYLMFQNTAYGNKWFYAFILGVEYTNNKVSKVTYQIDVMQTWYFDYTMKHCFVEREHSKTDVIGENLVPENLETGDYISTGVNLISYNNDTGHESIFTSEMSIVVACTFDTEYNNSFGKIYSNLFSGLNLISFHNTNEGRSQVYQLIANAGAKADGIFSIFMMPTAFIVEGVNTSTEVSLPKQYNCNISKRYDGLGDYTNVKNKKLYTYPYNFLTVSNQQGANAVFKYEYFDGEECTFGLLGDMSTNPSVMLIPTKYCGVNGLNYDEKISISGFPQLSFSTDVFSAWYAQNQNSMWMNTLTGAITRIYNSALGGAIHGGSIGALGGMISGVMHGATDVAKLLVAIGEKELMPFQSKVPSSPNTLSAFDIFNFTYQRKFIKPQFAKIIDDFFSMYGYATHEVKIPNIALNEFPRPYWCYTKTVGAEIVGSMPTDDLKTVISIYDKGITFWKNGENVGDYSLDNSV